MGNDISHTIYWENNGPGPESALGAQAEPGPKLASSVSL